MRPRRWATLPPVADFGGWYLRGDIGFSNQRVDSIRNTNPIFYAGNLSFQETTGFDTGGIYQLGAGYQFNHWFRVDVTGEYRGSTNFHGLDVLTYPVGGGPIGYEADNYSASKSEWLFLVNAYADLGTWWCITPYIGAGIGTARVQIANFIDSASRSITAESVRPKPGICADRLGVEFRLGAARGPRLPGQSEHGDRTGL